MKPVLSAPLAFGLLAVSLSACQCSGTALPSNPGAGDAGAADAQLPGDASEPGDGGAPDGGAPDAWTGPSSGIDPGGWFQSSADAGVPAPNGSNVQVDDAGNLVLSHSNSGGRYAWVANPNSATVSKIDLNNGKEVGRYWSVIPESRKHGVEGAVVKAANELRFDRSNSPSRTAVDKWGNVWVANRAHVSINTVGSVTKIAADPLACVDRNGDGVIQTSRDLNGNGVIDPDSPAGADWNKKEMIRPPAGKEGEAAYYDECVLFSTQFGTGTQTSTPRAVAIDSRGFVWVGLYTGMPGENGSAGKPAFAMLDPDTGEILPVNGKNHVVVPINSYGAAIDRKDRIWFTNSGRTAVAGIDARDGSLIGVVDAQGAVKPFAETTARCMPSGQDTGSGGSYGMNVQVVEDGELGSRTYVWVASGYRRCANWAARFTVEETTPLTGTWQVFDFGSQLGGESFGMTRGIAADAEGRIWISVDNDNAAGVDVARLVALDSKTGQLLTFANGKKVIDFTGHTWGDGINGTPRTSIGVGMGADESGRKQVWLATGNGFALAADRDTGAIIMRSPNLGATYTYSDFTGYNLSTFTSPEGTFRRVLTGCRVKTNWVDLVWEGQVPEGTSIEIYLQAFGSDGPTGQRFGPFTSSPVALDGLGLQGSLLLVEVVMKSNDREITPALRTLEAHYQCSGEIN